MSENSTTFDAVLDLCQHQHRRIVLGALIEEHQSLTLDDLTSAILTYNHQTTPLEASEGVLTNIHVSLFHVHLPKLAKEGLINYDAERQVVEPTERLEQVEPTLSTILGAESSLEAPMAL